MTNEKLKQRINVIVSATNTSGNEKTDKLLELINEFGKDESIKFGDWLGYFSRSYVAHDGAVEWINRVDTMTIPTIDIYKEYEEFKNKQNNNISNNKSEAKIDEQEYYQKFNKIMTNFKNGKELYHNSPAFHAAVQMLIHGENVYDVIEQLIKITDNTQEQFRNYMIITKFIKL